MDYYSKNWLAPEESVICKCEIEDELRGKTILIFTNHRLLHIGAQFVWSKLWKGMTVVGVDEHEQNDIYDHTSGTGNYIVNIDGSEFRFYSEQLRDNFYEEALRAILENQ